MPQRIIHKVRPLREFELKRQTEQSDNNKMFTGIKGCPVNLFLTQSARKQYDDWHRVKEPISCNFKLTFVIRDPTTATKNSRMDWLVESVTPAQSRHGCSADANVTNDLQNHSNETIYKKKGNGVRRLFQTIFSFMKKPFVKKTQVDRLIERIVANQETC